MSEAGAGRRRLHPATILLRFLKEAPSTLLGLTASLGFASRMGLMKMVWLAGALALALMALKWFAWRRFTYLAADGEIAIESGILHRNRRTIPFDRIQDVDIERTFLARLFGLAKVRIETGAGGKDEGLLDSVSMAEAERLRETVRAFHGAAPAKSLEPGLAAPPPAAARVVYAMDLPRLLLFGLFSFSLVYIAGIFAALQTFDRFLPFDVYDPARWIGLAGDYLPHRFTLAAIAAVLILAILLGVAAGVVRTVARDFGFRLSVEGGRFRREHGLFTRSEAVIARRRVQLAQVVTGPLRGRFGWSGLFFQTLGSGADRSGLQKAAPFATNEEVAAVLAEAGRYRLPQLDELERVSRRHIVRAMAGKLGPLLAAVLGASLWRPAALLLLGLVPFLGIAAALERRFHRYALDGELLYVARGLWRRRLWLVPLPNVQAVSLSRGLLQRKLGLATLSIDTAGAPALLYPRIVDLRADVAEALAEEIGRRRAQASGRKSGTDR